MLAKLEECSLLKRKDNLGNVALKQGKKFNTYSDIVKSNRKVENTHNKVKNSYNVDGFLIEGFSAEDSKNIDTALSEIKKIRSNINSKTIPSSTKRYEDNTLKLGSYTSNTPINDLKTKTGVLSSTDNTGRAGDNTYNEFVKTVSDKIEELKDNIETNKLGTRNFNEDELFDIIEKKKQEYNQLKSTEVLNGQLNNTQLTNKSYYLQYIIWLVAAISMGGLVLKKVFNN